MNNLENYQYINDLILLEITNQHIGCIIDIVDGDVYTLEGMTNKPELESYVEFTQEHLGRWFVYSGDDHALTKTGAFISDADRREYEELTDDREHAEYWGRP